MGQNNKLMSYLVNILLSSYIINIGGYCSPPAPSNNEMVLCLCSVVVLICCVSTWKCIVQLSSGLKRWHLDLNLMNKWWCHAPPFREVVKCLLKSCEVRDVGEKRARREVEGREVQEDGGRRCRERRNQQTFLLQSQRDGSGQESQSESDPGEQRYTSSMILCVDKVVKSVIFWSVWNGHH